MPAAEPLRAYLASRTSTGLLFVADMDGHPIRADTLRKTMRAHLDRLGLNNLHFHGLRHTAASALAEAGCTSHEIMAITGHRTEQMVRTYTAKVEQKKLATSATRKRESGGGET